ncbi:COG1501 Alpha-glucosidases, family 31 of glycosyl hydrolases [Candidatus Nanopelagicaceae bacterium]
MKFTDGFWLLREGVTALHATHLQKVEEGAGGFKALVAPKIVEDRGATLNSALFELEFSSPASDVIGVRIRHHRGGEDSLSFDFDNHNPLTTFSESEAAVEFSSGSLTAKLHRGTAFNIEFIADNRVITHQRGKSISIFNDGDAHYLSAQLNLGVGELVYGLGERFTAFAKNGQSVDIWNADGGTSSEQSYKNIPFYLTNRGYGVFVNNTGNISFEVASESVEKVQFSAKTQDLQYFLIYGPTPAEILEKYTALTGRAPQLPEWSFGLWLSTSFVTDYDEKTVTAFIDEMEKREIPLDVFHFDCFWMREYQWCDFQWDPRTFPDPQAMLSRLKSKGLKISLWINPYIGQASPLFDEGKSGGFFLKRSDGSVWQWDLWQAGNAIVDFTNPQAREWFKSKLRPLLEMGVDCFKTDFGERIPTDVIYHNGADPMQMHNLYTQLYNATVWELLQEVKGKDAIVFARSATVGGQKMPVHWGGDNSSSFESMAESLRGGLSLSLSGFGYWSHDIGGFEGHPDPAVFKRWLAFGLLSSHSRLHGNESIRVPWSIDEEAVDVTRTFTNLKKKLHPYLLETMREVSEKGLPMMRPMLLAFPDDPTSWFLDQQYMLGPDLLVAPIFNAEGDVTFYLPAGQWRNYFTNEIIEGGRWLTETHGFNSLPLYARR